MERDDTQMAANRTRHLRLLERGLGAWIIGVSKRPRLAIVTLVVAAIAGLLLASQFLGVNSDTSRMVSSSLDYRQAHLELNAAFPAQDNDIALVIRGRTPDEAAAFAALVRDELMKDTGAVEAVFAPSTDPFFRRNGLLFLDFDELDEVLPRISEAAPLIRRLGREPDLDDLYAALLFATDGTEAGEPLPDAMSRALAATAAVIEARLAGHPQPLSWQNIFREPDDVDGLNQQILTITPKLDYSRLQPARPAVDAIKTRIAEIEGTEGFEVETAITGNVALRSEELQSVAGGMGWALGTSFVFVAILLTLALRSAVLVVSCLGALVVSIAITLGFASVVFGDLNLVSVAFAVLLIGLGIDFSIHFAMSVQEERLAGAVTPRAMERSVKHIGAALALCAPTSAIAFFAFAPTQFVGMAQLGIISGVGVLVAFVTAITLLPAAFVLLPKVEMAKAAAHTSGKTWTSWFSRGHKSAVIVVLLLGFAALFLMPFVRFDADPMSLRDPDAPSVQGFNLLFDDPDTQPFTLSVLESDAEKAAETAARLEALPEVKRVIGLDDLVPEDQFDKADLIDISSIGLGLAFSDADNTNAAPDPDVLDDLLDRLDSLGTTETERLASALRLMAPTSAEVQAGVAGDIFAYWPDQFDLLREQTMAQPFEVDDLPEALRDRYIGAEGQYRLQIEPVEDLRSDEARARFVDAVRAADPRAAGPARSVLQSGRVISVAMVQAMALAFIAVTMLLWLVLRDIWLVGIILFCLSLAGVLTAATGVLIGMPFNFANIIVLPLLIGVGADSGIHLGLRAHERGSSASVFRTSTPRAVFYSAVTTIATFGTLSFSDHQGVASMGTLLTIAIAFTLICTVIVQPWLVERLAEVRRKRAIIRQRGLSFPIGDGGSGD